MKKTKLAIIGIFAAIVIVAGWGVTTQIKADEPSHNVSGEMYQSNGDLCSNPVIQIDGTSSTIYVSSTTNRFSGKVPHGRTLTFSADGCESFTSDPINSDKTNWLVELQSSNSSSKVKFYVNVEVEE